MISASQWQENLAGHPAVSRTARRINMYEFWEMLVFAGKNLKKRMKIFEYVH